MSPHFDRRSELAYIHLMFSWDARKALRNFQKHGVLFEEAATVFADPEALDWEDGNIRNRNIAGRGSGCP